MMATPQQLGDTYCDGNSWCSLIATFQETEENKTVHMWMLEVQEIHSTWALKLEK